MPVGKQKHYIKVGKANTFPGQAQNLWRLCDLDWVAI